MLRNPNYVLSLIVSFAFGFVSVLALPIGNSVYRSADPVHTAALPKTQTEPAPEATALPAPSPVLAAVTAQPEPATPAKPRRAPARQIDIASLIEGDDFFPASMNPARPTKWSYPTLTKLVSLDSSPFPYRGVEPRSKRPFLNHRNGEGRRTRSGRVYWANKTYSDSRVLLHIPRGFDTRRPAVMVLFFHGHGATLTRDVVARQQLPAQISGSGINAVLVAPQFAVDARDSSAGNFWKKGGTSRFLNEASIQLAKLLGDPEAAHKFNRMPVVIVGYSGGYVPTAWSLAAGGVENRVKGVVLLDGLYGEHAKFANWIEKTKSGFFLSAYAASTTKGNASLMGMLKKRGVPYTTRLRQTLQPGSVTFVKAMTGHRDYVTKAWARHPISDLLSRIPGTSLQRVPTYSASLSPQLHN